jgi:hypothetical protein
MALKAVFYKWEDKKRACRSGGRTILEAVNSQIVKTTDTKTKTFKWFSVLTAKLQT